MIKSKERILKHQYNRREFVQGAFEIILKDTKATVGFDPVMGYYKQSGATIIGMNYAEQSNIATIVMGSANVTGQDKMRVLSIDKASGVDKTVYSAIRNGQVEKIEEAEFKEAYDAQFREVPIWTFYEYLRAYHVIEIIIGFLITMGVYVWLK